MFRVRVSCVQEGPPEEVLDVLPSDLGRRRIPEPFRKIAFRVWNVVVAAPEQFAAIATADRRGMCRGCLYVEAEGKVDDKVEDSLERESYL